MKIKVIVACENASGEPDFHYCTVVCTKEDYEQGFHYQVAEYQAKEEGYTPFLAYDENDDAGQLLLPLFKWSKASLIKCH